MAGKGWPEGQNAVSDALTLKVQCSHPELLL